MGEYSKVKTVLLGAGKMGSFHAQKISSLNHATLYGVFDADTERCQTLAAKYPRCKAFTDLQSALEHAEAVVLAAATPAHFTLAQEVLNRRIPLLVEKPLAPSAAESRILVDLAANNAVLLAVGHIERYNPAYEALVETLHRQLLLKMEFQRFSPYPDRMQNDSIIFDMMIHDLDLALSLSQGSKIIKVEAKGKKTKSSLPDVVRAKVYFESGLIAEFEANRDHPDKVRRMVALGEDGPLIADLLNKTLTKTDGNVVSLPSIDQIEAEDRNFIAAARNKRSFVVSGTDALAAVDLAEQIEAALVK